jgi:hypothetical protein
MLENTPALLKVNEVAPVIMEEPGITSQPFSFAPLALSANATSGLPVSFSVLSGPGSISGSLNPAAQAAEFTGRHAMQAVAKASRSSASFQKNCKKPAVYSSFRPKG